MNHPLDAERAAAQLKKTGGTPFRAAVACELDGGLTVPASALNALRREALDQLYALRAEPVSLPFDRRLLPSGPEGRDRAG